MLAQYLVLLGELIRENQRREVTRPPILLRRTRKEHFTSVCSWKACASLSKNTLYDSDSKQA